MKIIDKDLLDSITQRAQESDRLRMNYNLHQNLDDQVQKLLNALEPGTDLPIHRHTHTAETYLLIRGKLNVLFYNDAKELIDSSKLSPLEGKFAVDIPAGQWHTIEVLEPGTIIFEIKQGPYAPLDSKDILTL